MVRLSEPWTASGGKRGFIRLFLPLIPNIIKRKFQKKKWNSPHEWGIWACFYIIYHYVGIFFVVVASRGSSGLFSPGSSVIGTVSPNDTSIDWAIISDFFLLICPSCLWAAFKSSTTFQTSDPSPLLPPLPVIWTKATWLDVEVSILNASQNACCWEFMNPLCHCAYSIVYRDLKVAKLISFDTVYYL